MSDLIRDFCRFDEGVAKLFGLSAIEYAYAIALAIVAMTIVFILGWRTYWGILRRHGFSRSIATMAEWFVVGVAAFNIVVVMARAYGREIVACPTDMIITLAATIPALLIGYIVHWYAGNKGSIRDFFFYVSAPVAAEVAIGSRTIANEVIRVGLWLFRAAA